MNPQIYLASNSPRRYEILSQLGYEVIVNAKEIDETPYKNEGAYDYVLRMAISKNTAAQGFQAADLPILSADTTVAHNNIILGKPQSPAHAKMMLQQLSGSVHQVLTAICVSWQGKQLSTVQTSDVHFRVLSDNEIDRYIASGEPMDKAGSYGIQGTAGVFVSHLSGSFTGVMGLPVFETVQLLTQCGWIVPPFSK